MQREHRADLGAPGIVAPHLQRIGDIRADLLRRGLFVVCSKYVSIVSLERTQFSSVPSECPR
jgi:hypothetical protein